MQYVQVEAHRNSRQQHVAPSRQQHVAPSRQQQVAPRRHHLQATTASRSSKQQHHLTNNRSSQQQHFTNSSTSPTIAPHQIAPKVLDPKKKSLSKSILYYLSPQNIGNYIYLSMHLTFRLFLSLHLLFHFIAIDVIPKSFILILFSSILACLSFS